tara:strand:+ start:84 stop:305 length:222 start_codon:yes stop_codon:yes gene_type:complete
MPIEKDNKWSGNAFISGLKSKAIFRLDIQNDQVVKQEKFYLGKRIRAITVSPNSKLWAIEDGRKASLLQIMLN